MAYVLFVFVVVVAVAVVVMYMLMYIHIYPIFRVKLAWILLENEDTWMLFVAYNWLCRGGGFFF